MAKIYSMSEVARMAKAQPFDGGFSMAEARRAAERLGLDFAKLEFSLDTFRIGMNHEREHGDVSRAATTIGKIALAHLREDADYYKKLDKIEKSEGPYVGPKGGLWADPQHTTPWKGDVPTSKCPRCKGLGHIVSRQTSMHGGDEVTSAACRTCNKNGKVKLDPQRVKAMGLPMPKTPQKPEVPERGAKKVEPKKPAPDARQSTIFDAVARHDEKTPAPAQPPKKFGYRDPGVGPARRQHASPQQARNARAQQHLQLSMSADLSKATSGPFIGPKGGKWADAKHTIPWRESVGRQGPRTGAIHVDEKQVRAAVDKLLEHAKEDPDDPEMITSWGDTLAQVPEGDLVGRTSFPVKTADGKERHVIVQLIQQSSRDMKDPRGVHGVHRIGTFEHKGEVHASHQVLLFVTRTEGPKEHPGGSYFKEGVAKKLRSVLAHELTHAADPFTELEARRAHVRGKTDTVNPDGSADRYVKYLNQPHEVAASIQQIKRDILDGPEGQKRTILWRKMRPEQMLEASERWRDVGQHYNEKNKRRVLQAVYALREGLLEGTVGLTPKSFGIPDLSKAAHKLHYRTTFAGMPISIENRKGSLRHWYDPHSGEKGSTKLLYPYGYIRRTEGADGGHVDVYIGPKRDAAFAYVIDQGKKGNWGEFDEQKVMLGFGSSEEAKQAYLAHYNDPRFFQAVHRIPIAEFADAVMHRGNYGKRVLAKAARGGKYIRRVPYTDSKGRKRYRYYYRDSAAARSAVAGEEIKLGKRLAKVLDVDAETGNITIQIGDGKPKSVTPDEWSRTMERSYGRQYRRWAAKRAKQAMDAVLRHVPREMLADLPGTTDAERLQALQKRAPKVYEKLQGSFRQAGVNIHDAKRVVSRVLERRGWREDARAVAIGSVLSAKTQATSIDQLIRSAENISDGIVESTDVAAAIELRKEATSAKVDQVAQSAHREDQALRAALEKAQGGDLKAAADVLAGALSSDNMQKLVLMLQAMPGLKLDAAEDARSTLLEVPSVAPGPKSYGSETALYVAEEGRPKALKARYRLMEAHDVVASHDPTSGFKKRDGYPEDVQERAYHRDKNEQMKVTMNAQKLTPAFVINTNPDAVNGPPMVTPDGIALGGNSRTMSMQKAYSDHPEKAAEMKAYLREHAHEFGLSAADVENMKSPILVREVQPSGEKHTKDEMRLLVRQMNESFTQAMDPRTMQVALGRKLSQATIDHMASGMKEGETLNAFLSSSRADDFLRGLQKDGVIDARNANQYRQSKPPHRLNEDGKTMVERILVGRMVGDADTLSNTQPGVISSVARAVPSMARAAKKAKKFDLGPALALALDARARLAAQGNVDMGGGIDDRVFKKAVGDLDDMFDPHPVRDDKLAQKVLEVLLKRPGSRQMPEVFDKYADLVSRESDEGQGGFFNEERSALDLLTSALNSADMGKSLRFGVPAATLVKARPGSMQTPGVQAAMLVFDKLFPLIQQWYRGSGAPNTQAHKIVFGAIKKMTDAGAKLADAARKVVDTWNAVMAGPGPDDPDYDKKAAEAKRQREALRSFHGGVFPDDKVLEELKARIEEKLKQGGGYRDPAPSTAGGYPGKVPPKQGGGYRDPAPSTAGGYPGKVPPKPSAGAPRRGYPRKETLRERVEREGREDFKPLTRREEAEAHKRARMAGPSKPSSGGDSGGWSTGPRGGMRKRVGTRWVYQKKKK